MPTGNAANEMKEKNRKCTKLLMPQQVELNANSMIHSVAWRHGGIVAENTNTKTISTLILCLCIIARVNYITILTRIARITTQTANERNTQKSDPNANGKPSLIQSFIHYHKSIHKFGDTFFSPLHQISDKF